MTEQQAREMLILLRKIELNTAVIAAAYAITSVDVQSYRRRADRMLTEDTDD